MTDKLYYKFWFMITTEKQWYDIMRECRSWFGRDWKSMSKVRRKLSNNRTPAPRYAPLPVWFEVPDPRFATWIAVKMSLQVQSDAKYHANK